MRLWRVWLVILAVGIMFGCRCAPRYTSKPPDITPEASTVREVQALLVEADSAYQRGVDSFVEEDFDSAATYLATAISFLSRDVDWASSGSALSERRILLYKSRYFLERIPAGALETPEDLAIEVIQPLKPPLPSIELVDNSRVQKWIRYFTGDGRQTFIKWVNRSGRYRSHTLRILAEEGLPAELVNLALIESGFNPKACSRAAAVGLWQFIRSTGLIYGLRIDWWVDERRDPIRSGRAAARHLRDLHEALDSWPLAMAAYNCGQRNVERAVKRARSREYWRLSLPRETRDYVPKFMAACHIMQDPHRYGFNFTYADPVEYEEILVDAKTDFKVIARACEVPASAVLDLNPHLFRECAPDGKAPYPVRIPAGKLELCQSQLAEIPLDERIAKSFASPDLRHVVRRGETLSKIARRYGTTISTIARANNISNYHRIRVGQSLLIPGSGYVAMPENPGIHVVGRGETLSSIAHRYRVRIRDLMTWNDLRSPHVIYSGQKLVVSVDRMPDEQMLTHTVKRGETISSIAKRHGVSTTAVLSANGLTSRSKIYPGQSVKVPASPGWAGDERPEIHTVKRGETITSIAGKYGVSIDAVLRLNGLGSRDRIYPGQEIRIRSRPAEVAGGEIIVHEVKSGETVTSIAERYGASTGAVLSLNGLTSRSKIYPGQKIKVSGAAAPGVEIAYHTVRRGDTISSIAQRYGVSVRQVLDMNRLRSRDTIYPGQRIKVPAEPSHH